MKHLLRLGCFLLAFIFITPEIVTAQPYCPLARHNNDYTITLQNPDLYNNFVAGSYLARIGWTTDGSDGCLTKEQAVTITKTTNLGTCVSGASGSGICITFPTPVEFEFPCVIGTLPSADGLDAYYVSIAITTNPGASPFFTMDFGPENISGPDPTLDFCEYIVIPVNWSPLAATLLSGPNRTQLTWTAYTESNLDHYSIEKSIDAITYYKIGQVAAVGSTPHNYSYIDANPKRNNYYRVVAVDIDCRRTVSLIRPVTCSACPIPFTPPSVTPDCPAPNTSPTILGLASVCDTNTHLYRLKNVLGQVQATWSISPSTIATLKPAGRLVGVKRNGTASGTATLTCTVVKGSFTSYYTKTITFGASSDPIAGNYSTSFDEAGMLDPNTYLYVHGYSNVWLFINYPYTNPTWTYQGGSITPNGWNYSVNAYEFFMPVDGWGTMQVTASIAGGCPKSQMFTFIASSGWRGIVSDYFATSPSKHLIRVAVKPDAKITDTKRKLASQVGKPATIKVFDMLGNLRKTAIMANGRTSMDIDAVNLSSGWYFVQIIHDQKNVETLKVWLK